MKNSSQISTVIVNGKEVLDFTPQSTSQSAIVPLSVIQRLASLLGTESLESIKREMSRKLQDRDGNINSLEKYVQLLQNEIDFHNTVNLLTMYEPEEDAASIADRQMEYAQAH